MTRQDYDEGFVTHEDYFDSVAQGVTWTSPIPARLEGLARFTYAEDNRVGITESLHMHGDVWHLATGVSTVVAAARLARRTEGIR